MTRLPGSPSNIRKVLAISSGGGHWVQLLRLSPVLNRADITYATVNRGYANDVPGKPFFVIADATRDTPIRLILSTLVILLLLLRTRPEIVISTGSAPGLIAIRLAKLLRKKTIWIDSIANADELSLSGRKAGPYADVWLTQWPHLAQERGPYYRGSVV